MKRWLVLTLGLGVAALAGLSLITGGKVADVRPGSGASGAKAPGSNVSAPSHHAEIDRHSRDQLRAILREADRVEADSP